MTIGPYIKIDIKATDMIRFYVLISNRHIDIDSQRTTVLYDKRNIQKWITF